MGKPDEIPIGSVLKEFPAGSFNALVRGHKRQKAQPPSPTLTKPRGLFGVGPWTTLEVVNESGATVDAGGVLGLDQTTRTVADDANQVYSAPELEGITPTTADHSDAFVVTLDAIEDGVAGPCVLHGAVWAQVYFTDETHKYAKVKSGDTASLESASSGARIVYHDTLPSLPDTVWAVVLLGGGDRETFRLIRGQSVGAQSGATVLIDNVLDLAGGLDPSGGNSATQITVNNLFGQSFSDNEAVQAIYHEGLGSDETDSWEAIKTTSGTETYRAIRGLVKGAVTADDTSFVIDNVIPLAGGLDPVAGNAATEITVQNIQKESFSDNEPVTAIYDGTNWEALLVERYRMIRGECSTSVTDEDTTFTIKAIEVLCSGLDPRSDPTSASETVTVSNIHADEYAADAKVIAVWNVVDGVWEALPRGVTTGGDSGIKFGILTTAASASSSLGTPTTDGRATFFAAFGGATGVTINNYYFDAFPVDSVISVDSNNNIVGAGCSLA